MLTGSELLATVKALGDVPRPELVRAAGYVSTKKDGSERFHFTAFYEALLQAKGLNLAPASDNSKAGRRLSFVTHVLFNGSLLVGSAYTALLNLRPGDAFHIHLGRRQIHLIPMAEAEPPLEGDNSDPDGELAGEGPEAEAPDPDTTEVIETAGLVREERDHSRPSGKKGAAAGKGTGKASQTDGSAEARPPEAQSAAKGRKAKGAKTTTRAGERVQNARLAGRR
jgi:hypothetical protein